MAIRERVLGKDHPDTATSLNNLAELLEAGGLRRRQAALRAGVGDSGRRVLGKDHPDTATCLNNLAGLLQAQGDYAAAKPLYERALAIREAACWARPPRHRHRASTTWRRLLQAQGDYAAAKPLYERALTILERVKGREHPDVATCLNNLADFA